jgi:hypothetical protein
MNRRQFLSLSIPALSVSLAGCTQNSEDGTETEQDNSEDGTETATSSPEATAPGCSSSMCEGTQIIDVSVSSDFSGTAVLETSCRDEAVSIRSGESVTIVREEDGEECGVTLFIDDQEVYGEYVEGHVSVTVTVGPDGEVDEERVMR